MSCVPQKGKQLNTVGFKKYFNLFGSILSLLGILFVVLRLRDYGIKVNFEKFTVISWLTLVSLSILYFFSNTLLAFGWHRLLCYYGLTPNKIVGSQGIWFLAARKICSWEYFSSRRKAITGDGCRLSRLGTCEIKLLGVGDLLAWGSCIQCFARTFYA